MKYFVLVMVLPFLMLSDLSAQNKSEIGLGVGASVYFGDMDSGDVISDLLYASPAIQLRYAYRHNPYFCTNVNFLAGKLKGDDSRSENAGRRNRNLTFFTPLYELSIMEEIHPLGKSHFPRKIKFSPFITIGVAGYNFNPMATASDGKDYELQPLGTEGQGAEGYPDRYKRYKIAIPFGGGLRYKINDRISMSFELISRYTFTDYLDDLSTVYAPENIILENGGPIAVELADRRIKNFGKEGVRGDSKDIDYYFTYMFCFNYKLKNTRISGIKDPSI